MKLKRNSYFTFFVILPLCAIVVAALVTGLIIRPLISSNSNNNDGGNIVENPGEDPKDDPKEDGDNPQDTPPSSSNNKIEVTMGRQKIHLVQLGVFSGLDGAKQHQSKLTADNINSFIITVSDKYRLIHSVFFDSVRADLVREKIVSAAQDIDVFASSVDIPEKKLEISYDTGDADKIQDYTQKVLLDLSKYCDVIFQYKSNIITQQEFLTEIQKLNNNNKSNVSYITENSSQDTQHLNMIKGIDAIIQNQNPDNNIEYLAKTIVEVIDIYINLPNNER